MENTQKQQETKKQSIVFNLWYYGWRSVEIIVSIIRWFFRLGLKTIAVILILSILGFAILGGIGVKEGALQFDTSDNGVELKIGKVEEPFQWNKPSTWF